MSEMQKAVSRMNATVHTRATLALTECQLEAKIRQLREELADTRSMLQSVRMRKEKLSY